MCGGEDPRNRLVCIDHFDSMNTKAGKRRWDLFNNNLKNTGLSDRTRIIAEFSTPALFQLMREQISENQEGFNLIYIDGSHRSDDTLLDAEMAWRIASDMCLIIFDDYEWDLAPQGAIEHPRNGIESFLNTHADEFTLLSKGYQIIIQKKVPLRVGFL